MSDKGNFNFRNAKSCNNCEHAVENNNLFDNTDFDCEFQPKWMAVNKTDVCDKWRAER